jgi:hypothetical protein
MLSHIGNKPKIDNYFLKSAASKISASKELESFAFERYSRKGQVVEALKNYFARTVDFPLA